MFSQWHQIVKCTKFQVSKRPWNFVAKKYIIPITAYEIFSTSTDTTPVLLILPQISKFEIKIRNLKSKFIIQNQNLKFQVKLQNPKEKFTSICSYNFEL